MMFREVLLATVHQLRALRSFHANHEVTLLRDIEGRMRLIVGTRDTTAAPLPDESQK